MKTITKIIASVLIGGSIFLGMWYCDKQNEPKNKEMTYGEFKGWPELSEDSVVILLDSNGVKVMGGRFSACFDTISGAWTKDYIEGLQCLQLDSITTKGEFYSRKNK